MKQLITALFLITVISVEFIDSRDDQSRTWLTICFDDHSCSQLLIKKEDLTNKNKRGIINKSVMEIIQSKENN